MATQKRAPKRATVYFDPSLHKALRVKAAETEQSLSDLVNAAVRLSLADASGRLNDLRIAAGHRARARSNQRFRCSASRSPAAAAPG
jgi:hypothetical protein